MAIGARTLVYPRRHPGVAYSKDRDRIQNSSRAFVCSVKAALWERRSRTENLEDGRYALAAALGQFAFRGKAMAPETRWVNSGGLLRLLADTFVLLYKSRHLSWRVDSGVAGGVRAVVRQDYRDLDETADAIARRILTLGRDLPPSYSHLVRSSSIAQELTLRPEKDMIEQIVDDHAQILADINTLEVALPLGNDRETAALLVRLALCHRRCGQSLGGLLYPGGPFGP